MIEIPLILVELERENYHILIKGHFQDKSPAYWIIDSGASKSVLDINLKDFYETLDSEEEDDYQSAGINQGMLETSVGRMNYLRFGRLEITNRKMALIDLTHVNDIYSKYTSFRISGLLGGDILMHYRCIIDYKRKFIRFAN